ncbi:MAG: O-antigen ligase family protein [Verrucomicrobiia bacterium]|jgi:hypothetical protein
MKFSEIINDQQLATEAIRRWITTAVCIVVAIVVAIWIAAGQFFFLALLAGVAVAAFVTVGLQRNAWILIVVAWSLTGSIHALSVPLETRDIVILVVTFSYLVQRVIGQTERRSTGVLGKLVAINCAYIAFTFVCHPVGLQTFGAETVGGRPYFKIFIAWCAYLIIAHMPDSYKSVTRIPLWLMASITVSAALALVVYIVPSITPYVWYFYSDIDVTDYLKGPAATAEVRGANRFLALAPFGLMLVQVLSAYFPPRTLINPLRWRSYLLLLGFVAILASGFRNTLLFAVASLALGSWFHRGWRDVVIGGVIGTLFIAFLVFGQGRYFELPLSAQRALGSLPGQWDDVIKDEVKISNSRWDWWRRIIEEGTIKNWWIGDGFGLTEKDYATISSGKAAFEDAATLTGSFHSGPLTAIRNVGVVGLILFYALMIVAAVYSVKCIHRCRGTPLLPVAIFLAIQLVWSPIHFALVFGSYDLQVTEHLFMVGLLSVVWYMSEHTPPSTASALTAQNLSRNNGRTPGST